jgi:hypothetical protein
MNYNDRSLRHHCTDGNLIVVTIIFLQQRSHLQAKKLGEDGVGECHLI